MNVLVVDVGGSRVKVLVSGQSRPRVMASGPRPTPEEMTAEVKKVAWGWTYDVVSIGYPGVVLRGRPIAEPHNLGKGWVTFDYGAAFGRPVKVINDAAMQALGSYRSGKMLFLGLGTGLGSTLIADVVSWSRWSWDTCRTRKAPYEDYVGQRGLEKRGESQVASAMSPMWSPVLAAALQPDDIVLGGGNVQEAEGASSGLSRRVDNLGTPS